MLPATSERVPRHTADAVNERIQLRTEEAVARCAAGGPEAIERRLMALDREWDIERTLEANASSLALVGLGLGAFVNRRYFALPAVIAGFLLEHALQGWCPPVPLLRRLSFRTQSEIDEERYALKALRGDFRDIEPIRTPATGDIRRVIHAVRS